MVKNTLNLEDLQRGSRPIPDSTAFEFIKNAHDPSKIFDRNIQSVFLCRFHEWVQESKLNNLEGIEEFNKLSYVHGSTQAFDFFYAEHKGRRMRCFKGEWIFYKAVDRI